MTKPNVADLLQPYRSPDRVILSAEEMSAAYAVNMNAVEYAYHKQAIAKEQRQLASRRAHLMAHPNTLLEDVEELSYRIQNALRNDNRETVRDVALMTDAELLRIPNLGRKSLNDLREIIPHQPETALDEAVRLERREGDRKVAEVNKAMMRMEAAHYKRMLHLETVVAKCAAQFKRFAAEARHAMEIKAERGSNVSSETIMRQFDDALTNDMLAHMCETALKDQRT